MILVRICAFNDEISLGVQSIATGSFPWASIYYTNRGASYSGVSGNITFTEYGSVGQFVAGTYTGTVSDSTRVLGPGTPSPTTYAITGSFRIRR